MVYIIYTYTGTYADTSWGINKLKYIFIYIEVVTSIRKNICILNRQYTHVVKKTYTWKHKKGIHIYAYIGIYRDIDTFIIFTEIL